MSNQDMKSLIKDFDSSFTNERHKEITALSDKEKQIFNHIIYYRYHYSYQEKYSFDVQKQSIKKLSDFVRHNYGKVVKILIPEELVDDFYYILDKQNKFQYSEGYYRRSFRCADYSPFADRVFDLIYSYYLLRVVNCKKDDIKKLALRSFEGASDDIQRHWLYNHEHYMLAARIDAGDTNIIDTIKEMITSENNTVVLTISVIRAVMCSSNAELQDLLCKLLVAARLSEGLRQAICENADCGTAEAFIKIMYTIKENNLIRFASVKRAVGTFTGICKYEDPDRLAEKILDDILYVLESREHALEYINTNDAIHIYMGLWGLGFYEINDSLNVIMEILGIPQIDSKSGIFDKLSDLFIKKEDSRKMSNNKIQILTIGYFCENLEMEDITNKISSAVLEGYPEDYQLFSMFCGQYVYNRCHNYKMSKETAKLHDNKNIAAKHYDILLNMYKIMPKKEMVYNQILFPWHTSSISKSMFLVCLLDTARVLDDDEKIDFVCERLAEIDTGRRSNVLEIISGRLKTPKQRALLINAVADKETFTRNKAVEILLKMKLTDKDYIVIESFAKYKRSDLREGVISLLKKRDAEGINQTVLRMIKSKDENVRLAALDLLNYGISEYKKFDFTEAKTAVSDTENPTEREEILINEIVGSSSTVEATSENGYGIYNPSVKFQPVDFKPDVEIVRNYFSATKEEITEIYLALMKLIDDNANLEYKDDEGEEHLLGNFDHYFRWSRKDIDNKKLYECIPFHELWANFYRETIKTPQRFWSLFIQRENSYNNLTKEAKKLFEKNQRLLFGDIAFYDYNTELVSKDKRFENYYFRMMCYDNIFKSIISEFGLKIPLEVIQNLTAYISRELTEEELWLDIQLDEERRYSWSWQDKKYNYLKSGIVSFLLGQLKSNISEDFEKNFKLLHELSLKNNVLKHYENDDIRFSYYIDYVNIDAVYYVKAYKQGIISEDILYKAMFEILGVEEAVSGLNPFLSRNVRGHYSQFNDVLEDEGRKLEDDHILPADTEIYKVGNKVASKVIDKILDVELKRGDSETVFSKAISKISRVYGMNRFIEILKAFGNDTLSRQSYYYGNKILKKDSLSHLLSVCYPTKDDNSEKLDEYMSKSKIKPDRLIEVAMFAPQWIDIIEDYLKIDGLKCGCYYFMAHTADTINEKRQAIIAKYTPLTREELNGGCFDVRWFKEAYNTLGDKMFNKIYKSAKYISSSNMHTRARKFADAALGKMDISETELIIDDKRNKDLLLSLAIIPSKDKSDILQRYEFIQKFLKESKQFGSQRRASESSAVQYSLKNLAVTAGYSDETRLTLSMETELVQDNKQYFSWNKIGEYDVMIEIDKNGKSSLKFQKNGKSLKSAPATIKKDEDFLVIKAFCDKLKQQYSRTVKMFELAMEERDLFSFSELLMLCTNPVTKSIVENLVFISNSEIEFICGIIKNGKLIDYCEKEYNIENDAMFRVAHSYDLYANKVWSEYQQFFLELGEKENLKQPFRQVFRELYVKLPEELDKEKSLMFAGNQIQTKRTVGTLKNRRWIADYEDGLQKVYYKDDIIAGIYAVADWFSPNDIEAPTLEGVTFVNRRNYKPIKISDLPDIVYSEVMRDVDLAVSVAHAGGVDPETSHSTVGMRKVILEFNLKLFGIKNVTLEKNHAIIDGKCGKYSIHLGSGVIHKFGGHQINVVTVSSGKKSKIFLPFIDEDPKTAEIMTKILTFAQDDKIKDPYIMEQLV